MTFKARKKKRSSESYLIILQRLMADGIQKVLAEKMAFDLVVGR